MGRSAALLAPRALPRGAALGAGGDLAVKRPHNRLETRRRAISRIALYGSLVLTGVLAIALVDLASAPLLPDEQGDEAWAGTDWTEYEEVEVLRGYLRLDTSARTGDVAEGARYLAELLEEAGIEPHLEVLGTGDANLWAVIEGKDPGAVVLHHHIDVTGAPDPEAWRLPPFAAEIDGPWLYGRGAFDMKSVGIAQLFAFLDLAERARQGHPPERSVIFLATSGEETGSDFGTRWILGRHPELADRFEVVLTEGGVVEGRGRGDFKYWGTEFAQKRFAMITVCDPSRERLRQLNRDLRRFGAKGEPERLTDEVRAFLIRYAPTRDREDFRRLLSEPERLLRDYPAFREMPGYVQAMYRTEMHSLGIRETDSGYELRVMVHMLPGTDLEDVWDETLGSWLFHGFTTGVEVEPSALHGSPLDHPALRAIEEVVRARHPDVPIGPMFLPWTATAIRYVLHQSSCLSSGYWLHRRWRNIAEKILQHEGRDDGIALHRFHQIFADHQARKRIIDLLVESIHDSPSLRNRNRW